MSVAKMSASDTETLYKQSGIQSHISDKHEIASDIAWYMVDPVCTATMSIWTTGSSTG